MKPQPATPGLLFGSFLFHTDFHSLEKLRLFWENKFEESFSFIPTQNPLAQYYSQEMGESKKLSRVFFLTSKPFFRENLLKVKIEGLKWEDEWSMNGKRTVNVDVGFLSLENFILATTKNYSHRIYLGQNIFADLTYYFHQGGWQFLPWTYPDYQDEEKLEFFSWGRTFLLQTIQS